MTITTRSMGPRNEYCQPRVRRARPRGHYRPLTNVQESENSYTLYVQAPGWNKEDISVNLENNQLKIKGQVSDEKIEDSKSTVRREFSKRSFERTFVLPKNTNAENIDARFENGILIIKIQKKEEPKGDDLRTIAIS